MQVTINGTLKKIDGQYSVLTLIKHLNYPMKGIAVALNDEIIPNSSWSDQNLQDGDRVEIVGAVQGG